METLHTVLSVIDAEWRRDQAATGSNRQDHRAPSRYDKDHVWDLSRDFIIKLPGQPADFVLVLAVKIQECILINNY